MTYGGNIHEVGGSESGAPESSLGYRWRVGVITVKRVQRELRERDDVSTERFFCQW